MKTLKELLKESSYKKTFNEIHNLFLKDKTLSEKQNFDLKFWGAWTELNKLEGCDQPDLWIYLVEVPAENEEESFIDVCMHDESEDEIYSLDFIDWTELINMKVKKPNKLSKEECLAHILWEITFWGFSNQQVSEERSKLKEAIKEND
jgi:hypothetical protein